jgi:ABC-type dipeptide/oligopeptide/nickel transport system ATPase component
MREGSIVELGPVDQILASPSDDYTRRLLDDTPQIEAAGTAATTE